MGTTYIQKGTVQRFNTLSGIGSVIVEGEKHSFGVTSFDSGCPSRLPFRGEAVDVVFVRGCPHPLAIRARLER